MTPHDEWVLLNPGPANTSLTVRYALLTPDLCHRELLVVRSDGPLEACVEAVLGALPVVREGVPR